MVGAITAGISALSSVGSAVSRMNTAKEQARKAKELRNKRVKAEAIQSEYNDVANKNQLMALSDMPGLNQAKDGLNASQANSIRDVQESAKTGSDRLSTLATIEGNKMKTLADLDIKNSTYKVGRQDKANESQLDIAGQKDARRDEARLEESKIRQQADALEVSATANRQNAIDDIFSTVSSTAVGLGALADEKQQAAKTKSMVEDVTPATVKDGPTTRTMSNATINAQRTQGSAVDLRPQVDQSIDYTKADSATIKALQQKLKDAGLYQGPIDGIFGPNSNKAYQLIK